VNPHLPHENTKRKLGFSMILFRLSRWAAAIAIFELAGCAQYIVADKLDTFVVINLNRPVGDVSECLHLVFLSQIAGANRSIPDNSALCSNPPKRLPVGGSTPVYVRAVNSRDLDYPALESKRIALKVVDRDGDQVRPEWVSIIPSDVITGLDGNNSGPVQLTTKYPGVYYVQAAYWDRHTRAVAYSNALIVQTSP
jgi:hypothetical protein